MLFRSRASGIEFVDHLLPFSIFSGQFFYLRCVVVSCFSPCPSLILVLQLHLMMRLTEMMNDLRICVVNYIHFHTLRYTGNCVSSHNGVKTRRTQERSWIRSGPRSERTSRNRVVSRGDAGEDGKPKKKSLGRKPKSR